MGTEAERKLRNEKRALQKQLEELQAAQRAPPKTMTTKKTKSTSKKAEKHVQVAHDSEDDASDDEGSDISATMDTKPAAKPSKALAALEIQKVRNAKKRDSNVDVNEEMLDLIKTCVKDHLWALVKIIQGQKAQEKATKKCLELMKLEDFQGNDAQTVANRKAWVESYAQEVTKAINAQRSYAQTRVKEACDGWMANNGGTLPTKAELESCLKRTVDVNTEEGKALFKWYWDEVLPKAAGNHSDWHPDHRHYMTISEGKPPNSDTPYITPSTEAFAVAAIVNNSVKWPAMFKLKQDHPGVKNWNVKGSIDPNMLEVTVEGKTCTLNHTKYHGLYTKVDGGQLKYSGWIKDGRDYFLALKEANEAARLLDTTLPKEQAILDALRTENGITANTAAAERKRKRQQKAADATAEQSDDEGAGFDFD